MVKCLQICKNGVYKLAIFTKFSLKLFIFYKLCKYLSAVLKY